MKNIEAVERFDQAGAKIDELFWIAGSISSNNDDLESFMEGLRDKDWEEAFPDIYNSESFQEYLDNNEVRQALIDFNKFGLIAEIHIPECDNFRYSDNGKPASWSVHEGKCRVKYVYAETLEELIEEIERISEGVFQKFIKKDKNKIKNI